MNIFFIILCLMMLGGVFFLRKADAKLKNILKIIGYALFISCFAVRLFDHDYFYKICDMSGLPTMDGEVFDGYELYASKGMYWWVLILRLLMQSGCFIAIFALFNKSKHIKILTSFYLPVVLLLECIFYYEICTSFIGNWDGFDYRYYLFGGELIGAIVVATTSLTETLSTKPDYTCKDYLTSLAFVPLYIFLSSYTCTLYNIVGRQLARFGVFFSALHICQLLLPFIIIYGLYFLFRNKDIETKWNVCLALTLMLFFKHFYSYHIHSWTILPLSLCHFGIVMLLVAVMLRNRSLAIFTLLTSTFGAILAMLTPNVTAYVTEEWGVHFLVDHLYLIVIPNLIFLLGLFEKVTFKDIKQQVIFNTIYFFVVCVLNMILLNLDPALDYLFLNNDFVVNLLSGFIPALANIRTNFDLQFSIGSFNFHVFYMYWPLVLLAVDIIPLCSFGCYKLDCLMRHGIAKVFSTNKPIAND